jgi:hypothetical protein
MGFDVAVKASVKASVKARKAFKREMQLHLFLNRHSAPPSLAFE